MVASETRLPGVILFEPRVFRDERGHFVETYHAPLYAEEGLTLPFVQDNWSRSKAGTLRGLHFQNPNAQGKLVMVIRGAIFDVAVDVRIGSPHFGKWFGTELTEENGRQLWIPQGFAHGFLALHETNDVIYKCTDVYAPAAERTIAWDDPQIGIGWPVARPLLSIRDSGAPRLADCAHLPRI